MCQTFGDYLMYISIYMYTVKNGTDKLILKVNNWTYDIQWICKL